MLTWIITPLMGKTPCHCKNTAHFAKEINNITLISDEEFVSADVTALFTSIPIDDALKVLGELPTYQSWKQHTSL